MVSNKQEKRLCTLHLFAGAGGGILGDILLGSYIIGAVEFEKYQREVLLSRQADGILPFFPIWDDVRTFRTDNEECREYIEGLKKLRDKLVIAGGFPCQDLSIAGKGEGLEGEKSGLWFEMLRIIREIRPRYIFVENSPMLIVRGFDRVSGDLTEVGYDLKWGIVGANDANAPHQRKRFWMWGELRGAE